MTKFSCQATGESEADVTKCSATNVSPHLLPACSEPGTAPEPSWAVTLSLRKFVLTESRGQGGRVTGAGKHDPGRAD